MNLQSIIVWVLFAGAVFYLFRRLTGKSVSAGDCKACDSSKGTLTKQAVKNQKA